MRRVSVAGLMIFVIVCAIGTAALKSANEFWAGVVLLLTTGVVGFSILAVVYRRGARRAGWLGFTLFSAGYMVMTAAPWFTDEVRPRLPTTYFLQNMKTLLYFPPTAEITALEKKRDAAVARYVALRDRKYGTRTKLTTLISAGADPELHSLEKEITSLEALIASLASPPPIATPSHRTEREAIGHNLFALLSGSLGALLASWLYRTMEPQGEPVP